MKNHVKKSSLFKCYKIFFSILILAQFSFVGFSQVYVNKYVLPAFSNPALQLDRSATLIDNQGNIITTGSNIVNNQTIELLTTKQSPDGQIIWQKSWIDTDLSPSMNYGVALVIDSYNNIIVTGTTTPDTEINTDVVIVKYSSVGEESWVKKLENTTALTHIPTSIVAHTDGFIFVSGVSQSITTQLDYFICKLDQITGDQIWYHTYDNQQSIDIPRNIILSSEGHPVVTGVSSSDGINWNLRTLKINQEYGNILQDNFINNVSTGSQEVPIADLKMDNQGNFYLLTNKAQVTQDILLTKLNSDLQPLWSVNYDLAQALDEATSLSLSNDGLAVVTASCQNIQGFNELVTLAYTSEGVLDWQQSRIPLEDQQNITSVVNKISSNGDIYSIGEIQKELSKSLIIIKYNLEGKKIWEQIHGNNNDFITDCNHSNDKLFVSIKRVLSSTSQYYTIRLDEYYKDNPNVNNQTYVIPKYRKNELVIKFDSEALNYDVVDNLDITFIKPEDLLTKESFDRLNSRIDFSHATAIRIFKNLKSTHLTSISRLNEIIDIPDFYATFIIDFPDNTNTQLVQDELENLFPLVKYSHHNFVANLDNTPNDPLYSDQTSLHGTGVTGDVADINVEDFWEHETGKPHIKVGIFDSGLDWEHEDFLYTNQGVQESVMVDGWDFETSSPLQSISLPDDHGHGTKCAGIVGAIRNNDTGIAGIAGGFPNSNDDYSQRGVALYGMRIFNNTGIFDADEADIEYIADAIMNSSIENENVEHAYGLHVMNNSWGISAGVDLYTPENIQTLREAVRFANKNKVTFVASRGNSGGPNLRYPSCYDDDWVVSVGGSGMTGNYKWVDDGSGEEWAPSYGQNMDVIAPCILQKIQTTSPNDEYSAFNGTSAAAPHVAGLSALILSYKNQPFPDNNNLSPEDVEFIIQESASQAWGTDYDDYNGFGRINAGESYNLIKNPIRDILHYDSNNSSIGHQLIDTDISINLTEQYDNIYEESFAPGTYTADVYSVETIVNHNLPSSYTILFSWERHSSSTLFPLVQNDEDLIPHEKVELSIVNQNQANLTGYVYELKDANNNSIGWIPFNIEDIDEEAELSYSLLVQDNTLSEVNEELEYVSFSISPNPNIGNLTISIEDLDAEATISISDILGKNVLKVYEGKITDSFSNNVNISHLPKGVYNISIISQNAILTRQFVKQ